MEVQLAELRRWWTGVAVLSFFFVWFSFAFNSVVPSPLFRLRLALVFCFFYPVLAEDPSGLREVRRRTGTAESILLAVLFSLSPSFFSFSLVLRARQCDRVCPAIHLLRTLVARLQRTQVRQPPCFTFSEH